MPEILNIVPVPVPQEALAAFSMQIPTNVTFPGFHNVFVAAKAGGSVIDSPYEQTLCDAFVLDAGARAEEQGYDGVVINSMSDSALAALRSRLKIPVVAPCQASMLMACMLGRRFSVVTMWPQWHSLYQKAANAEGIAHRMASIRDIKLRPDAEQLLAGKEDVAFGALLRECRAAIDEDGADVLILGSTTMHQSHAWLSERLEVPILNPGVIAYKLCESLVLLGHSHSKKAYPSPERTQDSLFDPIPRTFQEEAK
jgi:allantoin racemase